VESVHLFGTNIRSGTWTIIRTAALSNILSRMSPHYPLVRNIARIKRYFSRKRVSIIV